MQFLFPWLYWGAAFQDGFHASPDLHRPCPAERKSNGIKQAPHPGSFLLFMGPDIAQFLRE